MSENTPMNPANDAPRQVRLAIARIDPWTVMKVSFLLSVALGIVSVVAVSVMWFMLDSMHVFSSMEEFMITAGAERYVTMLEYVKLTKVISYTIIASVANVALMTALATVSAMLYNVIAALVGGVRIHLMDE